MAALPAVEAVGPALPEASRGLLASDAPAAAAMSGTIAKIPPGLGPPEVAQPEPAVEAVGRAPADAAALPALLASDASEAAATPGTSA